MAFIATTPSILRHTSVIPRACPKAPRTHQATRRVTMTAVAPPPPPPPRTVPTPLPRLLVYDHCPFCLRVRYVLGLKNVKYELVWLMNDDVATPTALVGKKVVPIFQPEGTDGPSIFESLDICEAIDDDARYGPPGRIAPALPRTDVTDWLASVADPMRRLTRPRYARAPLPEFVFADAREAYVRNHPLENPADYDDNLARSPQYIAAIEAKLGELSNMIFSEYSCSEGGVSYDDVVLFPRLLSLTVVKGLVLPPKVRKYVETQSRLSEVPLYDYCAM